MSTKGDWKKLLRLAEGVGCKVVKRRGVAFIQLPEGGHVTVHGSPSDSRALANAKADLKRGGIDL